MCVIHEVEVDTIKKDNLSLHRYNIFLSCCNLLLCYFGNQSTRRRTNSPNRVETSASWSVGELTVILEQPWEV